MSAYDPKRTPSDPREPPANWRCEHGLLRSKATKRQAYRLSLIANKAAFGSFVWDRPTEIDFNVDNFAVSHGQNFSVTETLTA